MRETSDRILNFSSMKEFSDLFKKDNSQVTNLIFEGIEEGIKFQKKSAHLFLIQLHVFSDIFSNYIICYFRFLAYCSNIF